MLGYGNSHHNGWRKAVEKKESANRITADYDPQCGEMENSECILCGSCIDVCEYGAIIITDVELPDGKIARRGTVNPSLCTGCGACVSVCESGAINLIGWSTEQIESMIDALIEEVE